VAVDLSTGAGLRDGLAGAGAVIDASNRAGGVRRAGPVMIEGTRRLLDAAALEGVEHHVAISIVGIDRVPMPYYRAKLAQERIVEEGSVPWSLVRATQFHPLLEALFAYTARAGVIPASRFGVQPVDALVAARVLVDAAELGPRGHLEPVAGPQIAPLGELARSWARARDRRVLGVALPLPLAMRRPLMAGALTTQRGISGGPSFETWLEHRSPSAPVTATA